MFGGATWCTVPDGEHVRAAERVVRMTREIRELEGPA